MKEQDKQLLLKDLSARLSYGIRVSVSGDEFDKYQYPYLLTAISKFEQDSFCKVYSPIYTPLGCPSIENVKPYLRPMSSMTEEEKRKVYYFVESHKFGSCSRSGAISDYLNSIHIDYRGLILKDLALEAPEGMYKI